MKSFYLFMLFLAAAAKTGFGQDSVSIHRLQTDGYISVLQSAMFEDISGDWMNDQVIHNRLNFSFQAAKNLSLNLQFRNRFVYGDRLKSDPSYAASFGRDKGMVDLSWNLVSKKSFLLNMQTDRAYLTYRYKKFQVTAGRQRINWGQTFVWNPNDLFNTYSFFDFDYPERPGSDALRLQYFTGYASGMELAVKSDSSGNVTVAGLVRFNRWNYDFQFLGGVYENHDFVGGLGWSGGIGGLGFYGEISYFRPFGNQRDLSATFLSTTALNYVFQNSLNLQAELMFAKIPGGFTYCSISDFLTRPLSVKTLAFSEFSFFGQAAYPVSPLLNVSFPVMWMPSMKAVFAGPGITWSISDNAEVTLLIQHFRAELHGAGSSLLLPQKFTLSFLRMKVNF